MLNNILVTSTVGEIKNMLTRIGNRLAETDVFHRDYENREMEIVIVDSYNAVTDRVVLFAVKGSPVRLSGVISQTDIPTIVKLNTNDGSFYWDVETSNLIEGENNE